MTASNSKIGGGNGGSGEFHVRTSGLMGSRRGANFAEGTFEGLWVERHGWLGGGVGFRKKADRVQDSAGNAVAVEDVGHMDAGNPQVCGERDLTPAFLAKEVPGRLDFGRTVSGCSG